MIKPIEEIKTELVDFLNVCEVKLSNSESLSSQDYYKIANDLNEAIACALILGNDKLKEEKRSDALAQ